MLYYKSNLIIISPNKSDKTQAVVSLLNTGTENSGNTSVSVEDASAYISSLSEQLNSLFRQTKSTVETKNIAENLKINGVLNRFQDS